MRWPVAEIPKMTNKNKNSVGFERDSFTEVELRLQLIRFNSIAVCLYWIPGAATIAANVGKSHKLKNLILRTDKIRLTTI